MSSESTTEGDLVNLVQQASLDLDQACQERHERGQQKYGEWTFLDNNTIEMAMEEIADLMNYMRYTWIRLWLLNKATNKIVEKHPATGSQGWIPTKGL